MAPAFNRHGDGWRDSRRRPPRTVFTGHGIAIACVPPRNPWQSNSSSMESHMNRITSTRAFQGLGLLWVAALTACSGGGGGIGTPPPPPPPQTYTIGGAVSGLAGAGLVLQDNGGNDLTVTTSGNVTFSTALASGTAYSVTVKTQPTSPWQTCAVTNASGNGRQCQCHQCHRDLHHQHLHRRRHVKRADRIRPRATEQRGQ